MPFNFVWNFAVGNLAALCFIDVESGAYQLGVAARNFEYTVLGVTVGASDTIQHFVLAPESHPGSWDIGQ